MLKFFTNTETRAYLRELAKEFGESSNAVRLELNRLQKAGLLKHEADGRTKVYRANKDNPLFPDIQSLVRKYLGIDLVEQVVNNMGNVRKAFVTGDYAKGVDSGLIDLTIVGDDINTQYLHELVAIAEKSIKRKIRTLILDEKEYTGLKEKIKKDKALVIWDRDKQ